MSTIGSGGTRIQGAACVPARYGLLAVAEVEDRAETEGHWQMGFSQDLGSCEAPIVLSNDCVADPETKESSLEGVDTLDGDSFTLISGYKCSTGGRSIEEGWGFAGDRLTAGENRAVERTFWTGLDAFGNPIRGGLGSAGAGAEDLTPGGGAVSVVDGLALLESWAGEFMSCAPIVHVNRGVAVYLANENLVAPSGSIQYSVGTGSRVVVGGGYLGTGPDGVLADPGEVWMFISGSVKVLRSPMFFNPPKDERAGAVNRLINDVTVFAERTYGFTRECGLAAVRVALPEGIEFPTEPPSAPLITGVEPGQGTSGGAEAVVITGSGFTGATEVLFGEDPVLSFMVDSDTQISVSTASHVAGVVDVTVVTPVGENVMAGAFEFIDPPIVDAILPVSGPAAGGTEVVITGSGFTGATLVAVGGEVSSFVLDSDTQITAITALRPGGPATVNVAVDTAGGYGSMSNGYEYT